MSAPISQLISRLALVRWLLLPCGVCLLLPLIGRALPHSSSSFAWATDLLTHWQFLYALAWIVLCLLAATQNTQWLLLLPFSLLPLVTATSALPRHTEGERTSTIVVAAANVYVGNRDPAPLVAWLKEQPVDVLILSELSESYAKQLTLTLGEEYRYRELHPKNSPFGIGIISKLPLSEINLIDDSDGVQRLGAIVTFGNRSVRLYAAHPMPPLAPEWHMKRNQLLSSIIQQEDDVPTIVAGDLNATPWSTALYGAQRSGLLRATGLKPTWPRNGRGVFGIPIDHVLATSHWKRVNSGRGPDIGSDHYPVVASLQLTDKLGD